MPAPENIPSIHIGAAFEVAGQRWRQREQTRYRLAFISPIQITLNGKVIATRENRVGSEAGVDQMPVIVTFIPLSIREGILMQVLGKNSVVDAATQPPAVTHRGTLAVLIAAIGN
jgi:hypothetical protein